MGRCTPRMISARATPQDLPDPRPPRNTLYRQGENSPRSFLGNLACTASLKADRYCAGKV